MKINVLQLKSEYIAVWWFNALFGNQDEIAEWIDADNYCEIHGGEMTVWCNNADCGDRL